MDESGYKLKKLASECGDLHTVILPLVNKVGQAETARKLGLSQFTVSRWLKRNGYKATIVYVKDEPEGETA